MRNSLINHLPCGNLMNSIWARVQIRGQTKTIAPNYFVLQKQKLNQRPDIYLTPLPQGTRGWVATLFRPSNSQACGRLPLKGVVKFKGPVKVLRTEDQMENLCSSYFCRNNRRLDTNLQGLPLQSADSIFTPYLGPVNYSPDFQQSDGDLRVPSSGRLYARRWWWKLEGTGAGRRLCGE